MTVFVLWGENCFSENGEVAWVEGIYSTLEGAKAAKAAAEQAIRDEQPHLTILDPEIENDEIDGHDWDRSFNIEEHEVQS